MNPFYVRIAFYLKTVIKCTKMQIKYIDNYEFKHYKPTHLEVLKMFDFKTCALVTIIVSIK